MKNIALKTVFIWCLAAFISTARASFTLNFEQVGNDVVATGSGTVDLAGLTSQGGATEVGKVWPSFPLHGSIVVAGGTNDASVTFYTSLIGPSSVGSGNSISATSGSGDMVGIIAGYGIYVPSGYVSGSELSDTATWFNKTIANLGLTPGTEMWTWGSGPTSDSFILNVGTVPEPASLTLFGVGGLLLCRVARQHRSK